MKWNLPTAVVTELELAVHSGLVAAGLIEPDANLDLSFFAPRDRRPESTSVRITASRAQQHLWSIKAYPLPGVFDAQQIAEGQRALYQLDVIRIPHIAAEWGNAKWSFIAEEYIPDALDLGTLVAKGVVSDSEAREIQGRIFRAIHHQEPLQSERCHEEMVTLIGAIADAPLPPTQQDMLRKWTETNYLLISHPPIWTTRDIIPTNILQAPTGPGGEDEWWLTDFDLACRTSLLWFDVLRAARMSPWGISYWDGLWGDASGLAFGALSRLMEWNVQRHISGNHSCFHEHAVMLQSLVDSWCTILGHTCAFSLATLGIQETVDDPLRDVFQIYLGEGDNFSEDQSIIIPWAADSIPAERHAALRCPNVPRTIRLDFSNAACLFELSSLSIQTTVGRHVCDLNAASAMGDAVCVKSNGGLLIASLGPDPQIVIHIDAHEGAIQLVTIVGTKHKGIDRATAEKLTQQSHVTMSDLSGLVQAGDLDHLAEMARERRLRTHAIATESIRRISLEHQLADMGADRVAAEEEAAEAHRKTAKAEEDRHVALERALLAENQAAKAEEDRQRALARALHMELQSARTEADHIAVVANLEHQLADMGANRVAAREEAAEAHRKTAKAEEDRHVALQRAILAEEQSTHAETIRQIALERALLAESQATNAEADRQSALARALHMELQSARTKADHIAAIANAERQVHFAHLREIVLEQALCLERERATRGEHVYNGALQDIQTLEKSLTSEMNHVAILGDTVRLWTNSSIWSWRRLALMLLASIRQPTRLPQLLSDYRIVASSRRFDVVYYLRHAPDVATAGVDPIVHYLLHGSKEGRNPCSDFSTNTYLANERNRIGRQNPFAHWLTQGCPVLPSIYPSPDDSTHKH